MLQNFFHLILVNQAPAVLTVNAESSTIKQYVHVYLDSVEHLLHVVQNAWLVLIALLIRRVVTRNVLIHVKERVVLLLYAKWLTIILYVHVHQQ